MKPIPIDTYPFERTYKSFEAAIDGANNHPLQQKAKSDTELLIGSKISDAFWTDSDFAIGFSNGKWLHIFVLGHLVRWEVKDAPPDLDEPILTVGSPVVVLDWGGEIGQSPMDRSALISCRIGKQFYLLFVNECGLFVYTKGDLILCFHPVLRTDTGKDILFITEED